MKQENKNHDSEQKFNLSDKFSKDMKTLFKASETVPPEIDMAILNKASQKLSRSRSGIRILRWIGPIAAAAAIIIFVCISNVPRSKVAPMENTVASIKTDIDYNGRVDILDAFKLTKLIQSETILDKKWDINGDGLVDSDDVDEVALVAVSLD